MKDNQSVTITNLSGAIEHIIGILCHLGEKTSGASVAFIFDRKNNVFTIVIDDDILNGENVVKYADIPIEANLSGAIEQILGILCHLGEKTSGASVAFIFDRKNNVFTIVIDDDILNGENVVKYADIPIEAALDAAERNELTEPVIASIVEAWEQINGFEPADGSPIAVETYFNEDEEEEE